jgi:hypothetical protein
MKTIKTIKMKMDEYEYKKCWLDEWLIENIIVVDDIKTL